MDPQLFKIVKRKTKRGYPEGELRNELRLQGIPENEINELFNAITPSDHTGNQAPANQAEQYRLLASACLIITGIAFLSLSMESFFGWLFLLPGIILLLPYLFKKIAASFQRKQ